MKKKKGFIITIIILIIVIAAGFLLFRNKGSGYETVKTAAAAIGDIKSYLSTNATIESKSTKTYMGASQLTVKSITVNVGDKVSKGQLMLSYDLADLSTSLQQAGIQYSNALLQRDDLLNQKKQLEDTIKSLDSQITQLENSQNPINAAQLQTLKQQRNALQPISDEKIKLMDNSVSLAKLALDTAQSKYDKYKDGITADFSGTVTTLNAVEGSVLSPTQPAIVLQQLDNLKAILALGKYDAIKVKPGQEAVLTNGSKIYKGIVSYIDPAAVKVTSLNGQSTSLEADIDIPEPDFDLKVGFDVNADILVGSALNALKIPIECIKYDKGSKTSVFTVVNGIAKQVDVELGVQSDTEAQVVKGLNNGDIVILNPGISINDGTHVKIDKGEK